VPSFRRPKPPRPLRPLRHAPARNVLWSASKKKLDAKHAAQDALSLAKKAKTPEDMLAKAETAIAMYMEYKKHMTSRCSDFDAQIDFAKKIAELAQRELDKPLIQRWLEEHWELIITG